MANLLEQTINAMTVNGKSPANVQWVGVIGDDEVEPFGTWEDFERLASIDYDDGYGSAVIADGLVVVGQDWWLERCEYDGAEWWEFKTIPRPPATPTALRKSDLKNGR